MNLTNEIPAKMMPAEGVPLSRWSPDNRLRPHRPGRQRRHDNNSSASRGVV